MDALAPVAGIVLLLGVFVLWIWAEHTIFLKLIALYEKEHPGKCGHCSWFRFSHQPWEAHVCKERRW